MNSSLAGLNNIQYNPPVGQQGSVTQYGGGGSVPVSGFRSILDARLGAATGKTPEAQYPDGYLGSITDRHGDKLLDTVKNNARGYQRGVHKGSRISGREYFWTRDFNPYTTVENRIAGDTRRFAAQGNPLERLAHGGKYITNGKARELAQALGVSYDPQTKVVPENVRTFHRKVNMPGWGSGRSV